MEYYAAIKENELLMQATNWMNFKGIMLNGKSQSQKVTYYGSISMTFLKGQS